MHVKAESRANDEKYIYIMKISLFTYLKIVFTIYVIRTYVCFNESFLLTSDGDFGPGGSIFGRNASYDGSSVTHCYPDLSFSNA